jgi:hypothetical protein
MTTKTNDKWNSTTTAGLFTLIKPSQSAHAPKNYYFHMFFYLILNLNFYISVHIYMDALWI